jgi:hypothetical protein
MYQGNEPPSVSRVQAHVHWPHLAFIPYSGGGQPAPLIKKDADAPHLSSPNHHGEFTLIAAVKIRWYHIKPMLAIINISSAFLPPNSLIRLHGVIIIPVCYLTVIVTDSTYSILNCELLAEPIGPLQ